MRRIARSRKADPPGQRIKVGTCGFAMRRQEYYQTFPVVEIQQSFYKLPRATTGERWRAGAPPGFEFTMKAWQLITHEASSPTYRRLGKPIPPEAKDRYGAIRYFRLHGLTGYRYVHTDQDLQRLAAASRPDLPTYCLFNNIFMAEDAVRFQELLKS